MIKPLFQKIIVAVNGSEQSIHAAMYAIMMAKTYKCQLKAVYVVDTAALKQLEFSKIFLSEESKRYETNLVSDGHKYLSYVENLAKQKGIKIDTELRKGSIWSQVITVADEFDADLILLGGRENQAHSMGNNIKHDKTSSTNSEIIGSARCNVLVVRKPEIEKLFKIA